MNPQPEVSTLKGPYKGPSWAHSAGTLRKFLVLVGNFIRKSKFPVQEPISCFSGADFPGKMAFWSSEIRLLHSNQALPGVRPALHSKCRSNGHCGGEIGRVNLPEI